MQIGVTYGPEYNQLIKTPAFKERVTAITARRNAWKMMTLQRIDGIISDEATALLELRQLGLGGLMADGQYKTIFERYLPCTISVKKLGCK